MDQEFRNRVLGLLEASLGGHTQRDAARRVKLLQGQSLQEALSALTEIERKPGLPAKAHRLVAMCKQALTGKLDYDSFLIETLKDAGLYGVTEPTAE